MITHFPTKFINSLRGGLADTGPTPSASSIVRHPAVLVSLALACAETLPASFYGRYLAKLDPMPAALSTALSFVGTTATYLIILQLSARRAWLRRLVIAGLAIWTVALQVVYFGIYREFATLPTVSIVDFVRQTPDYAWALFVDRVDLLTIGLSILIVCTVARGIRAGVGTVLPANRVAWLGLGSLILASYGLTRAPFMTFGQQVACLIVKSSHGPGVVNVEWTPDRARASTAPAKYPVNVVVFRLEEIAAFATTLDRPELPTTPRLRALAEEHPDEVFVARQHFSNSTATDVSVLSIYTGLSPAADLEAHRHIPLLWDYFAAAGYDTSMFIPFHVEWGDFKRRFNARPDELHLNRLLDAGNSGSPIAYDNSINDTEVIAAALAYQNQRQWHEPFFQIVSLKMPHAIGEGARVNKLDYGPWENESPDLNDYYNGIRHDDDLLRQFMAAMPDATRDKTVFFFLSDHGTRLFERTDGAEELHRLDNYHAETTKVPFVVYIPHGAQRIVPRDNVQALKTNLADRSTSNIDFARTAIALTGITPVNTNVQHSGLLLGRDLSQPQTSTEAIVQLNTGPLRRWDREHFGLVLRNGRYHYIFSMGRELLFDRLADPRESRNVIGDAAHGEAVANARAIIAEIPELLRIQHKYKRQSEVSAGLLAQAATTVNLLTPKVSPIGVIRLYGAANTLEQPAAAYEVAAGPSTASTTTALIVRGEVGQGSLEWRLRRAAKLTHYVHVDRLSAGATHRLMFHWRQPEGNQQPLSIELYGFRDSEEFAFRIEKATTYADVVEASRELEIVSLASDEGGVRRPESYAMSRFSQHPCLEQANVQDCPNGYLAWGPYANATKGTEARLRYDIQVKQTGVKAMLDLSVGAGQSRMTQSRTYQLEEAGVHTFQVEHRLDKDAEALEGRLSIAAEAHSMDHPITIENAELTLLTPNP